MAPKLDEPSRFAMIVLWCVIAAFAWYYFTHN